MSKKFAWLSLVVIAVEFAIIVYMNTQVTSVAEFVLIELLTIGSATMYLYGMKSSHKISQRAIDWFIWQLTKHREAMAWRLAVITAAAVSVVITGIVLLGLYGYALASMPQKTFHEPLNTWLFEGQTITVNSQGMVVVKDSPGSSSSNAGIAGPAIPVKGNATETVDETFDWPGPLQRFFGIEGSGKRSDVFHLRSK